MGIRIFAFVDDFFGGSYVFHSTELAAHIVKTDLFKSGFVVNPKKSRWVPTQKDSHLDFIVDLKEGILSVTPARIQKLNKLLDLASKDFHLSARKVASLVGSIISMGLGIGPAARFRTRASYSNIEKAVSWDEKITLCNEAINEIKFRKSYFHDHNGQPIWPLSPIISVLTYSDASDSGWAGYSVNLNGYVAKGNFSPHEYSNSSTWRELKGTANVLHCFGEKLRIEWLNTDRRIKM